MPGVLRALCLLLCVALLLTTCILTSCGKQSPTDTNPTGARVTAKPPEIVAINYPLYSFCKQLAGDWAEVTLPVPGDIDPAQWQPQLNDILKLQQADLVVLNGAGYSNWLDKVALSSSKLLDSSAVAKAQWIELTAQTTHSHGPKGQHSHGGYAFTTWMDLELARQQAIAIAQALGRRWPERRQAIEQRQAALLKTLASIDQDYRDQAAKLSGKNLIYSHPVYQYFERRYQLPGHSLHWEPGAMPTEQQWHALQSLLVDKSNALFIWEDFPDQAIAERMTTMGLEFVVIRPAANRSDSDSDWQAEQQANLQRLTDCCR